MKHILLFGAIAILIITASVVVAQTGGGYDLTWSAIDSGGAMFSTGGGYSLGGAIGQADAGTLSGGGYTLNGGFWAGVSVRYNTCLPVIVRQ